MDRRYPDNARLNTAEFTVGQIEEHIVSLLKRLPSNKTNFVFLHQSPPDDISERTAWYIARTIDKLIASVFERSFDDYKTLVSNLSGKDVLQYRLSQTHSQSTIGSVSSGASRATLRFESRVLEFYSTLNAFDVINAYKR